MSNNSESDWEYPAIDDFIAGVFKGGGAKGLVYGGALHELRARGVWFNAAAGSSAGAITATLIAAGFPPDKLIGFVPDAMAMLKKNRFGSLSYGMDRGMYATKGLEEWLEQRLVEALGLESGSPRITFEQLHQSTRFDLYVVAMDLASSQPIVFNHVTSPQMSVTEAVMASSAIPVAMRTRRVLVQDNEGVAVHRLVDGGAWANFPRFVFADRSFRAFNGLSEWPTDADVVGFTIEAETYGMSEHRRGEVEVVDGFEGQRFAQVPWPADPPQQVDGRARSFAPVSSRLSIFDHGSGRRMGVPGAVLTWMAMRRLAALLLLILGVVTIPRAWPALRERILEDGPDVVNSPLLLVSWFMVVGLFVFAIAYAWIEFRYFTEAAENGLPALTAALSVGTGVPDWVGFHPQDHVVRLSAPAGIGTTTFHSSPQMLASGLAVAGSQAAAQLAEIFPGQPRDARVPAAWVVGNPAMSDDQLKQVHANLLAGLIDKAKIPKRNAEATFVWAFYLVGAGVLIFFNWPDIYVSLVVLAGFSYWLVKRMALGRQLNQSMLLPTPVPQRYIARTIWVLCASVMAWVAVETRGRQPAEPDFMGNALYTIVLGLLILSAFGGALSVISRLLVNAHRNRYLAELNPGKAA